MTIPIPTQQQSFGDWADSLRFLRPDFEIQPIVVDIDDWQDYAFRLMQSTILQTANAPRPDSFDNWQDWAQELIKTLGKNI